MPARVLHAGDAHWRPSNQMGVLNSDLAKQLHGGPLAARFWLLEPGQASTRHRHVAQTELYVVVQGTGRSSTTRPQARCGSWWERHRSSRTRSR